MKQLFVFVILAGVATAQTGEISFLPSAKEPARCATDASIPKDASGLVKIEPLTREEAAEVDKARAELSAAQAKLNSLIHRLQLAHGECGEYWMEWSSGRSVEIRDHWALTTRWHTSMMDQLEINAH